jgi:putative membrane protein
MLRRVFRTAVPLAVVAGLSVGSLAFANEKTRTGSNHRQGSHQYQHNDGSEPAQTNASESGQTRVSAWDEEWLKMSIEGDRFEIIGGQIALKKSHNAAVIQLANRLIADHSKSLRDAVTEAKEFGIEVPDTPSPSQQWELNVVSTFSGNSFDHWYSDLEVKDHMQDIQETQDEIDKGSNPEIKQLAQGDLPVLQEHLKLAQQALAASSQS